MDSGERKVPVNDRSAGPAILLNSKGIMGQFTCRTLKIHEYNDGIDSTRNSRRMTAGNQIAPGTIDRHLV